LLPGVGEALLGHDDAPDEDDEHSEDAEAWQEENGDDEPVQLAEFEDQIALDLELLKNEIVELDSASGGVLLQADQLRPLNAVIADALVRYEYDEARLTEYMFTLMGVRD